MILTAGAPSVTEVAAFIGPLIAAIGLIGGLIAWVMTRTSRYVKNELTAVQSLTNERIANLTAQLLHQGQTLETLQKQSLDLAITVARIEGKLTPKEPT